MKSHTRNSSDDGREVARPVTNIERLGFGLHSNILLTVMREQADRDDKVLAELVMNSIAAAATGIDVETDGSGFTLTDDGHSFSSKEQVEFFDSWNETLLSADHCDF